MTQDELQALRESLIRKLNGVIEIRYADRMERFQTISDILKAISQVDTEITTVQSGGAGTNNISIGGTIR